MPRGKGNWKAQMQYSNVPRLSRLWSTWALTAYW